MYMIKSKYNYNYEYICLHYFSVNNIVFFDANVAALDKIPLIKTFR